MGPEYFGIDTRRWTWNVRSLPNPRLGIGWGRIKGDWPRTSFFHIWLGWLWLRLEWRGI